mmetsp:Transcript_14676/g.32392  ORF Transcript_14676/g.32392 Transcript_14676/m.32392 type:complete len:1110 (-) Transcript_14676:827-4156(-)
MALSKILPTKKKAAKIYHAMASDDEIMEEQDNVIDEDVIHHSPDHPSFNGDRTTLGSNEKVISPCMSAAVVSPPCSPTEATCASETIITRGVDNYNIEGGSADDSSESGSSISGSKPPIFTSMPNPPSPMSAGLDEAPSDETDDGGDPITQFVAPGVPPLDLDTCKDGATAAIVSRPNSSHTLNSSAAGPHVVSDYYISDDSDDDDTVTDKNTVRATNGEEETDETTTVTMSPGDDERRKNPAYVRRRIRHAIEISSSTVFNTNFLASSPDSGGANLFDGAGRCVVAASLGLENAGVRASSSSVTDTFDVCGSDHEDLDYEGVGKSRGLIPTPKGCLDFGTGARWFQEGESIYGGDDGENGDLPGSSLESLPPNAYAVREEENIVTFSSPPTSHPDAKHAAGSCPVSFFMPQESLSQKDAESLDGRKVGALSSAFMPLVPKLTMDIAPIFGISTYGGAALSILPEIHEAICPNTLGILEDNEGKGGGNMFSSKKKKVRGIKMKQPFQRKKKVLRKKIVVRNKKHNNSELSMPSTFIMPEHISVGSAPESRPHRHKSLKKKSSLRKYMSVSSRSTLSSASIINTDARIERSVVASPPGAEIGKVVRHSLRRSDLLHAALEEGSRNQKMCRKRQINGAAGGDNKNINVGNNSSIDFVSVQGAVEERIQKVPGAKEEEGQEQKQDYEQEQEQVMEENEPLQGKRNSSDDSSGFIMTGKGKEPGLCATKPRRTRENDIEVKTKEAFATTPTPLRTESEESIPPPPPPEEGIEVFTVKNITAPLSLLPKSADNSIDAPSSLSVVNTQGMEEEDDISLPPPPPQEEKESPSASDVQTQRRMSLVCKMNEFRKVHHQNVMLLIEQKEYGEAISLLQIVIDNCRLELDTITSSSSSSSSNVPAHDTLAYSASRLLGSALHNVSIIKMRQNDYDGALDALTEAISLRRNCHNCHKQHHPLLSDTLAEMANALAAQNHISESLDTLAQAMVARTDSFGQDHPYVAKLHNDRGCVQFLGRNDLEGAQTAFETALDLQRSFSAHFPRCAPVLLDISTSLGNLAVVYVAREEYRSAAVVLQDALVIQCKVLSNSNPIIWNTLHYLSLCKFKIGKYQSSIQVR